MRVVLYARVSTKPKKTKAQPDSARKEKSQDTENQLAQLRDFCQRQGWTITHEYIDTVSAKTANRPQFQAMFAAASRCEFDLVLFWALDRFSREGVFATLQHLQKLNGYGVNWRSFTEQYLDSIGPFRDAVLGILATIAKQERVRLSERTLAGLDRARRQGKRLGRPRVVADRGKILDLRKRGVSLGDIAAKLSMSK